MPQRVIKLLVILVVLVGLPNRTPAPLVYKPGEGWTYEKYGESGEWQRTRAKDQLQVAQEAFDRKDYSLSLKAAKRTVANWPLSDYAPQAQYLIGRCREAKKQDQWAFDDYQKLLEKYPKSTNFTEAVERQLGIADKFLAGKWWRLWGYIPIGPSMDKTVGLYQKILRNGAYSPVGPQAQMGIGAAREKQKEYDLAAHAYERAADRYVENPKVASDAVFKAGLAYLKEVRTADYDQTIAGQAIATFSDFSALYPEDPRVPEAQKNIGVLKMEQARGAVDIAKFYERRAKWQGALIYYNEAIVKDPNSKYATEARERIAEINKKIKRVVPISVPATNAVPSVLGSPGLDLPPLK